MWKGLWTCLTPRQRHRVGHNLVQLPQYLKRRNRVVMECRVNGEVLTPKQMKENLEAVREYDLRTVSHGYLCSCCDPFLILFCAEFHINLEHEYMGHMIRYDVGGPVTHRVKSNRRHFGMWRGDVE